MRVGLEASQLLKYIALSGLIESQKYRVSLFAIVYAIKRLTLNCSCASQGQGGCWSMLRKLVSNSVRRVQNSLS